MLIVRHHVLDDFKSARLARVNVHCFHSSLLNHLTTVRSPCSFPSIFVSLHYGMRHVSRPASAPFTRCVHDHDGKPAGNKGGGGELIALSRMAGGSSCAPAELRIMKWVVLRETYLTKLRGVVSAERKRAKSATTTTVRIGRALNAQSDYTRRSPKLFNLLTELLTVLRRITVEIVEAVERWRGDDKGRPFIWGSSNYLVKVAGDIEFLAHLPGLEEHLGVIVPENPFLSHTGLDGRCTALDRSSIRSRCGRFPLNASGKLGVSAERVAAAAAVLYREVRRAGRRRGGGRGREEGVRPCFDVPPRVVRSPSSRKNRPISPPERYRLGGSGPGKRSGVNDKTSSGMQGERRRRPVNHSDAAVAADDSCSASPCLGGDHNLHGRDGTGYCENHHREEQLASEEGRREQRHNIGQLDGGSRRVSQSVRRRSSGPELTEVGESSRRSQGARRYPRYDAAGEKDRQASEERRAGSRTMRRKSSAAPELAEAERDSRHTQQGPRRSLSYDNEAPEDSPHRCPLPSEEGEDDQDRGVVHGDNRRATETWHLRNNPADGGRRRASQFDRRRSSGYGDSRHAQGERRRSMPHYAVREHGDEGSCALPPDDQSLDYQNGGGVYRYEYHNEQHDGGGTYRGDDQNLDYYYEEGGYGTYADDENEEEFNARDPSAVDDEPYLGKDNYDHYQVVGLDPADAESRPDVSLGPLPATAPEDGAAKDNIVTGQPSGDGPIESPPDPAAMEAHRQEWRSDAEAPVVVQTTEALPAVTGDTRSSDDHRPDDGNHGRMGRRGSPFNLIFNMCDGMLTDLKGLEGRSYGGEDDAYEFQPTALGNPAYTRYGSDHVPTAATIRRDDDQEEEVGGAYIPPAEATVKQNAEADDVAGAGRAETPPPPALRGAVYASLTRNIIAMSREGGIKRKAGSSGGDGGSDTGSPNRIMTDVFSAWAEKTEGRLRHRDAKAESHYRLGRLRHAMSAWETHRATFLGHRMAEAFAGSFGLSSRFFVRFTFDALRAHARGGRLAARNRAILEKFVSRMERFGKARLRQAWRRWALPRMGPEFWGAEHDEALRKLCWHWGRDRLRGALRTWRRQPKTDSEPVRPPLHASGSFAVLKGKLKTVGSFVNPNTTKPPRSMAATTPKASRQQEESTTSNKADFKDEGSWAEWLDNEASISVVSPDGKRASVSAAGNGSSIKFRDDNNVAARGTTKLPSSRSFHGLGAAIKSIKSFRDGRDKSQVR